MNKFKFSTIILVIIAFIFISIHLVTKIKEDKLFMQTNLCKYVYSHKLESSFYIANKRFYNFFNPRVPLEFDFISKDIEQNDIELCLSKYIEDIFVLQLKIEAKGFKSLLKKYETKTIAKIENKETIYIIEYTKDKCIFAFYQSNILTFSTSHSFLKEIIKESKNTEDGKSNSELFNVWLNLQNELKIYSNDNTGDFVASFNHFGSFLFAEYNQPTLISPVIIDSLKTLKQHLFIKDECTIYDLENIENKIIFKIK